MGLINRPTKLGGNNTYVAEVAAGFTIIRASEVDADLNTIYDAFDGNISNANVAAAAAIAYSKLDLTASIINTDIAPGAAIDRSKLAALPAPVVANIAGGLAIGSVETNVVQWVGMTCGGGTVIFLQSAGLSFRLANAADAITWRWKEDGTTLLTITQNFAYVASLAAVLTPITPPNWSHTPVAGSHNFALTAQLGGGAGQLESDPTNPGLFTAIEVG